mmetsp:Transcript_7094/g.24925  ORF Transcript_7094/g.24925 Transcript_7094/m.24925 type:complete len:212 (-) Transcript_7094:401-1036(-)
MLRSPTAFHRRRRTRSSHERCGKRCARRWAERHPPRRTKTAAAFSSRSRGASRPTAATVSSSTSPTSSRPQWPSSGSNWRRTRRSSARNQRVRRRWSSWRASAARLADSTTGSAVKRLRRTLKTLRQKSKMPWPHPIAAQMAPSRAQRLSFPRSSALHTKLMRGVLNCAAPLCNRARRCARSTAATFRSPPWPTSTASWRRTCNSSWRKAC